MHRSKDTGLETQNTWHIGESVTWHLLAYVDNVFAVQADGDELMYVLSSFGGLPFLKARPMRKPGEDRVPKVWRWFGDDAKFIVGNL